MKALLDRIERYCDAVPRTGARPEDIGPFTLFVAHSGWPYYARPRLGFDGPFTRADIADVRERQRKLGVPEAFEWVSEVTPALLPIARESGLPVHECPLMVLHWANAVQPGALTPSVTVRLLEPDDPALAPASAVAAVSFATGGVAAGVAGPAERDAAAAALSSADLDRHRDRISRGLTVTAVAEDASGPIAVGSHQPVGDVTEIVGVATLPARRRRGVAAAVTAALIADAARRNLDVVFLSAGSEQVARIYERTGFVRVGTACLAEAP